MYEEYMISVVKSIDDSAYMMHEKCSHYVENAPEFTAVEPMKPALLAGRAPSRAGEKRRHSWLHSQATHVTQADTNRLTSLSRWCRSLRSYPATADAS